MLQLHQVQRNLKIFAAEGSKQNEIDLLRQQSSKQAAELDNVKKERAAEAEHLSALIKELAGVKEDREMHVKIKKKH